MRQSERVSNPKRTSLELMEQSDCSIKDSLAVLDQ